VNSFANVENAVILPRVDVGRSARLRNVVIDAEVKIPEGLVVGEDPELDAKRFRRTEHGICLITQPMIDKLSDQPSVHPVPARESPLTAAIEEEEAIVDEEQAINGLDASVTAGELEDEVVTSGLKA
jgi:NDP-sugar pyrophosphorylase family protein